MEMPGRRSSYSLVSQFPDDPPLPKFESPPSDKSRGRSPFDWPLPSDAIVAGDHRAVRIGPSAFPSAGLQRQSSGSSYGESSLSGDYYLPTTLSSITATIDEDAFNRIATAGEARAKEGAEVIGSSSSSKSWAQQAEETYQLQLALALRLCSEAACASYPNFLDAGDQMAPAERASAESMSHRFWVNGCLSYHDKIPDGFYLIQGMDPFVWTLCTDVQEESQIPSVESLKTVHPSDLSIEVVLIDRKSDLELCKLQNLMAALSCNCSTKTDMAEQLAKLVCTQMGGAAFDEEENLIPRWKEFSEMLADMINLPCRVAKGCAYCKSDDASSCLVRVGLDREYLVDLIGKPGQLCEPDSLLNGPYCMSISSPMHPPKFKSVEISSNLRSLAKQYFSDCQSLNLIFSNASAGTVVGQEDAMEPSSSKHSDEKYVDVKPSSPVTSSKMKLPQIPQPHVQSTARPNGQEGISQLQKMHHLQQNITGSEPIIQAAAQQRLIPRDACRDVLPLIPFSDSKSERRKDFWFMEEHHHGRNKHTSDITFAVDDLTIPWTDLVLKERIGAGSFGTVHRADWHGKLDCGQNSGKFSYVKL
ncbi:putative serine/threonine-protein kinase CTR1 [Cocos nucifera]|nr:putative serine/threonine-protein kinase CTR1 [Cocos nucifera]